MSPTLHSLPRLWGDPAVSLSQICLLLPLLSPLGMPRVCPGVPLLALISAFPNTSIGCSVIDFAPLPHSSPTPKNPNLVWCEIRAFLCPKSFHVSWRTGGKVPQCGAWELIDLALPTCTSRCPTYLFEPTSGRGSRLRTGGREGS